MLYRPVPEGEQPRVESILELFAPIYDHFAVQLLLDVRVQELGVELLLSHRRKVFDFCKKKNVFIIERRDLFNFLKYGSCYINKIGPWAKLYDFCKQNRMRRNF